MPQGASSLKSKAKGKVPSNAKNKPAYRRVKDNKFRKAAPQKANITGAVGGLQMEVSKQIRKNIEGEMRARAIKDTQSKMDSKKQKKQK